MNWAVNHAGKGTDQLPLYFKQLGNAKFQANANFYALYFGDNLRCRAFGN